MPCRIKVDSALKSDILDFPPRVRKEIRKFLLALQENPFPESRRDLDQNAFYLRLPSGCFISWEIFGKERDLADLLTSRGSERVVIRILGAGFAKPEPL